MEVNQQTFRVSLQAYLSSLCVLVLGVKTMILVTVYLSNITPLFENIKHWTFKPFETLVVLLVELITIMDLVWKVMMSRIYKEPRISQTIQSR